ncbi:MAG: hypothetical protein J6C64_07560 [Lachnospiraceae bacterium]|nr:hypothetical protein [Lachnospiraceae bacterium]
MRRLLSDMKVCCIAVSLTAGVILAAAAFGIVKRQSYTNLAEQGNYMEQLQVAEIPEKLAIRSCSELAEKLPDAPIILRVRAEEEIEHLFQTGRQKVHIQEVYAGESLKTGEEIYLFSEHWRLSLTGEPDSIERGFVNVMEVGTEYLVFAAGQVQGLDTAVPVFELYDDFLIAPVFCYEDRDNVIVPVGEESTYVPYRDVKNNEFFAETEKALLAWEELKEKMISAYGKVS